MGERTIFDRCKCVSLNDRGPHRLNAPGPALIRFQVATDILDECDLHPLQFRLDFWWVGFGRSPERVL